MFGYRWFNPAARWGHAGPWAGWSRECGDAWMRHGETERRGEWEPPIYVVENKDGYIAAVELPGVSKDRIKVTLADDLLTLSGEKPRPPAGAENAVRRDEWEFGPFRRTLRFTHPVQRDGITAEYRDGVLTLRIPKKEKEKTGGEDIKIQ